MPNWVMNELTCIFQTQEEYNAFKEKINLEGLYNSFIPAPDLEDTHNWNLDNWGVKWDAVRPTAKYDLLSITLSFDSPWGCPEQFVRELSKLYPNATFEMVSGSIENDCHYEFTCDNGKFEETCSYETFKEAVEDGKWGGMEEWEVLFEESEEIDS